MLYDDYICIVDRIHKDRLNLNSKKSKDYADKDVLSNFKRVSQAAKLLDISPFTPWGYALFMSLMKMDRFNNIAKQGSLPENEGMLDTIQDLHNYIDLCYASYFEEE